jgi:hypothetical protein
MKYFFFGIAELLLENNPKKGRWQNTKFSNDTGTRYAVCQMSPCGSQLIKFIDRFSERRHSCHFLS